LLASDDIIVRIQSPFRCYDTSYITLKWQQFTVKFAIVTFFYNLEFSMDKLVRFVDTLQFDSLNFAVIPAIFLLIGGGLIWRPLVRVRAYIRLQQMIRKLGNDWLRDVYIPATLDGHLYIEYLLLTPNGLLLLHVKPYYGNIFAGEQIEFWTQVIGHKSFKFINPIHQLQVDMGELRSLLPKTAIQGQVLFTTGSRFPKGKPENVLRIDEIKPTLNQNPQPVTEDLAMAWQELCEKAQPANQIRLRVYLRRGDLGMLVYGGMLMGVGLGWLVLNILSVVLS